MEYISAPVDGRTALVSGLMGEVQDGMWVPLCPFAIGVRVHLVMAGCELTPFCSRGHVTIEE